MCGLTFVAGKDPEFATLIQANRLVAHRGPDDEGYLWGDTKTLRFCEARELLDAQAEARCEGYWLGMG
ncbi:hypothetical protein D6833_04530, partial [Candidatus Parcubacteria bacterium]